MVDIIPYTEDDEDESTWIPLSPPSPSSEPTAFQTHATEPQEIQTPSHHSQLLAAASAVITGQSNPLLEQTILSHLTTAPPVQEKEEYASEDDGRIVWRHADELKEEKLLFRRNEGSHNARSSHHDDDASSSHNACSSSYNALGYSSGNNTQRQRQHDPPSRNTTAQPNNTTQPNNSTTATQLITYRQQAQTKLSQTLLYHPMRSLPFILLCNLYTQSKFELYTCWNEYLTTIQNEGGSAVFAPIIFYLTLMLLGILLIGVGVVKIAHVAIVSSVKFAVSSMKMMIWGAVGLSSQLAAILSIVMVILGILTCILVFRVQRRKDKDEDAPWTVDFGTWIPGVIALGSNSVYELVVILYSIQAFRTTVSSRNEMYEFQLEEEECVAVQDVPIYSAFSWLMVFGMAVAVIALTAAGVAAFSAHLDAQIETSDSMMTDSKHGKASSADALSGQSISRIKRHLNACHTLSIAILALSAVSFLLIRAIYLYFGGDLLYYISGLGSIGFHLVCIVVGVALVTWAGKLAVNELPTARDNDDGRTVYQRIARNALKESIIDITTNAVWSNVSGLSGVLSEEDGILRLAVLEWLVDRWTLSSGTSEQPSASSQSEQEQSDTAQQSTQQSTTTSHAESNNADPTSSANQANTNASSTQQASTGTSINIDILKALPSYQSLEEVISKLDADESLIPAIDSYRTWIYSLPPSRNVAMAVSFWKMCPGMTAMILILTWSRLMGLKEAITSMVYSQLLADQCGISSISSRNHLWITTLMLTPLMYLEYLRVRRWWARVFYNISEMQSDDRRNSTVPDSLAIMLQYDYDETSASLSGSIMNISALNKLILHTWNLLLESIAILESSIPVVRCATVACAAANLTNDAACLVDLAVEIKHRGLFAGIGILLVDAFSHHLQEELRRRREESNDGVSTNDRASSIVDELGGKYTSSIIKSVGHASKIVHNLSKLRVDNKDQRDQSNQPDAETANNDSDTGDDTEESEQVNSTAAAETESGETVTDSTVDHSDKIRDELASSDAPSYPKETQQSRNPSSRHTAGSAIVEESSSEKSAAGNTLSTKETSEVIAAAAGQISPEYHSEAAEAVTLIEEQEEQTDGGLPMWLGGGLAVVGAVVGGLAVAAATGSKKEDKKERKGSSDT